MVAAGSLLGVAIHEGVSFPVGKVDMLDVRPMSFCEFLEAMGEDLLAEVIVSKNYRIMSDWRERLSFWLKNYYYVGGMPEVVQYFSEHKDYLKVRELQNMILRQYEDDFGKHATSGALARTRMVWNSIPMQLAKENKKFFFGQIKSGARMKDFEIAIEWLLDCGLITKVYKVNKPAMPLKAYIDFSAIKLFLLDVGLLGALSEVDAETILEGNAIFTEFKGALTEQFVLQEIVTETAYTPYYFATDTSTYEIDFMIQKQKDYAIRTSMADYRDEEWLINLPLYAVRNL